MNPWRVILATMVIFAAGVLTGGVLTRTLDRDSVLRRPRQVRNTQAPSPGALRIDFLRRAQRELDLTAEQREKVDRILKESQERSKRIMEPVAPELRQEFQHTREAFRAVLTSEQQTRFDELLKKQSHTAHRTNSAPVQLPPELIRTNG